MLNKIKMFFMKKRISKQINNLSETEINFIFDYTNMIMNLDYDLYGEELQSLKMSNPEEYEKIIRRQILNYLGYCNIKEVE